MNPAWSDLAFVVSGLAPRRAAKRPQNLSSGFTWKNAVFLMGPLRGPARGKPAHHKELVHHYAGAPSQKIITVQKTRHRVPECIQPGVTWLFCGERACPALGCKAAPKAVIRIYLEKRGVLDGAASRPSAGQARSPQKPAHHKKSVHHYAGAPSQKIIPLQKTCHRVTECIQPGVTWLLW
ncbi:hypothetical protein ACJ6YK_20555 [Pseudomonas marginalis]|uniref:hypothetical protein n=1 Tax=Pseudomonas TaxID=286 RepID=UPI00389A6A99